MATYRQAGSPYWNYDFTLDGRRYRGSCKTSKVALARAIEAEKIQELRRMGPEALRPRKPILLQEVIKRFLELVEASPLEASTKKDYEYGVSLLGKTALPAMQVRHITADIITLEMAMIVSPYTANAALRTLRRILNKAKEWSFLVVVPRVKLRKAPGRDRVYSGDQEAALLKCASAILRDVLTILIDTGMRPFEVMRMRIEDVRWDQRSIHIPKSKTPKGIRDVAMSSRVMDILLVRCAGKKSGWVFPSKRSDSGYCNVPREAFRRARELTGLDAGLVIYTARHTFGTYAMEATGNAFAVGKAMGHANLQSMEKYQHPGLDKIRDAIDERNLEARHNFSHSEGNLPVN